MFHHKHSFRQYPVLSLDVILGNFCWIYLHCFTPTCFLYEYSSLPLFDRSHLLCHFFKQDFFTAVFISCAVTNLSSFSSMLSASFAAIFANLSAISFPTISACPGVQAMLISRPFCFRLSISCLIWFIVP